MSLRGYGQQVTRVACSAPAALLHHSCGAVPLHGVHTAAGMGASSRSVMRMLPRVTSSNDGAESSSEEMPTDIVASSMGSSNSVGGISDCESDTISTVDGPAEIKKPSMFVSAVPEMMSNWTAIIATSDV